jgi:hypothetical protein
MRSFLSARLVLFGACMIMCGFCLGCLAVYPTPTRTVGAPGGERKGKVGLDFIRVGTTGREEVVQKLGWTDVGIKDERLFQGRWVSSSWGVTVGDPYGSTTSRIWGGHNLLIEFDEKGVVKRYSAFGDAELVKQLSAWDAQGPDHLLDLSRPIEFRVEHLSSSGTFQPSSFYECTLVLAKDSLEFRENEPGWHSCDSLDSLKVFPTKISQLSLSGPPDKWPPQGPDPQHVKATLHFTDNTKVGQEVTLILDVPAIMSLVKYVAQMRSR